jgi:hypothetical protein
LHILNYCLDLPIQLHQLTKISMKNSVQNPKSLMSLSTEDLKSRYDFVNNQLIFDQFRRNLSSQVRDQYQNDWFETQVILQQRNNLTK